MKRLYVFFRNWSLPLSMLLGALAYFVFVALPLSPEVHHWSYIAVTRYIQPVLLFVMLFLSFTKVRPGEMRPHRWQAWVLLLQGGIFLFFSILALSLPQLFPADYSLGVKVLLEGAMLAMICPTATASAVIVGKLGGSIAGDVTYLILCNLMVSLLAPAVLPLVESNGLTFFTAFWMILSKVFPLLIFPLFAAWGVRYLLPRLHQRLLAFPNLSFHVWVIALALAITVTVRSIVHSNINPWYLLGLFIITGVCCILQFDLGHRVGAHYGDRITPGQAFGQKNTVFIIWMAQVFLNPVTSVVGGFYSVFHNCINSYQLYQKRKQMS